MSDITDLQKTFVDMMITSQSDGEWVDKALVKIFNSYDTAVVLKKIIFWSAHGKRRDGWIYKSDRELSIELGLTHGKLRRIRENLEKAEWVYKKLLRAEGSPTNHFLPNYTKIFTALVDTEDEAFDRFDMETIVLGMAGSRQKGELA